MAADERSEDLSHGQPVGWRVVRDVFQGVDAAQADIEPIRTALGELVDGSGEPLGDLAFLGDGDLLTQTLIAALGLLAGEFELFAGAVVTELRLLAGLFELSRPMRTCRKVTVAPIPAPPRTSRTARA
jgi:hypothetical protein